MRTTLTTTTTSTTSQPKTGREFALSRELLGVSVYAVASRLGVDSNTLRRWEADCNSVDARRGQQWRTVLASLAQLRAQELGRAGFAVDDLRSTDLGRLILKMGGRKFG